MSPARPGPPEIVAKIRAEFPTVPIIATGGPREEDILRTIEAGANAITYTPPTTGQLFADIMVSHRKTSATRTDPFPVSGPFRRPGNFFDFFQKKC